MKNRFCCSNCNRFFGYESLKEGLLKMYCSNCKSWTILRATKTETVESEDLDNELDNVDTR